MSTKDEFFNEPNRRRLRSNLYEELKKVIDRHTGIPPRDQRAVLMLLAHNQCSDFHTRPRYRDTLEKQEVIK